MTVTDDEQSTHGGSLPSSQPDPTPIAGAGIETRRLRAALGSKLFGPREAQAPPKVGRHTVLAPLGRGGMGVVYAAYDPQLDRKVAIKVLRTDRDQDGENGAERLLAEAQKMAKLNHPHVVAVHDAGVSEGQVFIAMEHIEGGTLGAWCKEHPPADRGRFDRALDLLLQAARGMAAAHDVGLVHRDLKPANMLIDGAGRLRVADFGLARLDDAPTVEFSNASKSGKHSDVAGTPVFMAPEQLDGHADARSDQWSWCATAWEVVYGDNPFAGTTSGQLIASRDRGAPSAPSRRSEVPGWFHTVLTRGLSPEPNERYVSMAALLRDVERRRDRGRRWVWIGAVGSLIALGAWGWSDTLLADAPTPSPCAGVDAMLGDAYEHSALRDALAQRWGTNAPGEHDRLLDRLDTFARDWTSGAQTACASALAAGRLDDSASILDAPDGSLRCFRDTKAQLETIVSELTTSDDEVRAFDLTDALPALDRCRHAPDAATIETPDTREAALELARVRTHLLMREHDEARALLDGLSASIDTESSPGIAAAISVLRAMAFDREGDHDTAREHAQRGLTWAERSGSDSLEADAWKVLADTAFRSERLDEAEFYADRLASISASMGNPAWLRAPIARVRAAVAHLRDQPQRAHALLQEAIAASAEVYGPDDRRTAAQRELLVAVLRKLGRGDEAIAQGERVLATYARQYGPEHPRTAKAEVRFGSVLLDLGQTQAALEAFEHGNEVLASHPAVSPQDAIVAGFSYAQVLNNLKRYEESNAIAKQTQERARATLGAEHPYVSALDMVRAANALDSANYPRAIEAYRNLLEANSTPERLSANTHIICVNLATAYHRAEQSTQALEQMAVCDALVGSFEVHTPVHFAGTQQYLAEIEDAAGHTKQARARYEEAAQLFDEHAGEHPDRPKVHLQLARIDLEQGKRDGVAEHLDVARAMQGALSEDDQATLTELTANLEKPSSTSSDDEDEKRSVNVRASEPEGYAERKK